MSARQMVIDTGSEWEKNLLLVAVVAIAVMVYLWPDCNGEKTHTSVVVHRDTITRIDTLDPVVIYAPADTVRIESTTASAAVIEGLEDRVEFLDSCLRANNANITALLDTVFTAPGTTLSDSAHIRYTWPANEFMLTMRYAPRPVHTVRTIVFEQSRPAAWTDNIVVSAGIGYGAMSIEGQVFTGSLAAVTVGYRLW